MSWQSENCVPHDEPSLKRLAVAGVTILTGSDSGNLGVFEGYSVHRELQLMVESGMDPWEALAGATTHAGDFLGRHYGVHVGDEANLVVLSASPIPDIFNTEKISLVVARGQIVR
jgi:imidazolonepropionase-like amidohydrolase